MGNVLGGGDEKNDEDLHPLFPPHHFFGVCVVMTPVQPRLAGLQACSMENGEE